MKRTASRTGATYSAGERGRNRVRLFADRRTGILQLEYRCADGRTARTSCQTRDLAVAKRMADALAARLATGHRPASALTLRTLFDNWDTDVGAAYDRAKGTPHAKPSAKRRQDRRAAQNVCDVLGSTTRADRLTPADARRFLAERTRRGDRRTGGTRPLGTRAAAYDLKVLLAALRWAVREGRLDRSPLEGFRIAGEVNPKRPVLRHADYLALLAVADMVHPYCRSLLVLARETGHRLGAILALRWADVHLDNRTVTWRAATDKKRREHETPLSDAAMLALDARAAGVLAQGHAPEGYIFPASAGEPVRSDVATAWWRRMEHAATLAHEDARGWHSLRRAFASELAPHVSLAAIKALAARGRSRLLVMARWLP